MTDTPIYTKCVYSSSADDKTSVEWHEFPDAEAEAAFVAQERERMTALNSRTPVYPFATAYQYVNVRSYTKNALLKLPMQEFANMPLAMFKAATS